MNQTAIEVAEPKGQITALSLLQMAVDRGANIDTIERLAKLQREMQDHQTLVDFDEALNRCQQKLGFVAQDMERADKRGKYASYEALNRAIRPIYSEEGFSVSFSEEEGTSSELIVMIGLLCRRGHKRPYRKVLPVDSKGPKGNDVMTKTDASCAASSRAKRYVLKAMFNLAEGEEDNDGNGAGSNLGENAISERIALIEKCADRVELQRVFGLAYKWADDAGDKNASGQIIRARDKRKQELAAALQPQGGNRIAEPLAVERLEWIKGANDKAELTRIYNNAIKMANQAGDTVFADQLTKAANARAKEIHASV